MRLFGRYILFAVILLLLAGEKKMEQRMFLSYAPSGEKGLIYESKSDGIVQVFVEDYSQTSQTHSTSTDTFFYLGEDSLGRKSFRIGFGEVEATVITGGEIKTDETQTELEGESLTLIVNKDWQLEEWRGLEGMGYDDAGIDRGELVANIYAAFTLVHLPDSAVYKGYTWEREFSLGQDTERGKVFQDIKKRYKVKKFTEKDGHNCVEITLNVELVVRGEGKMTAEGEEYSYWSKGKGKGKGKLFWDYENGYLYKGSTNWLIDFEITTESASGKVEKLTYSQETKLTNQLVE